MSRCETQNNLIKERLFQLGSDDPLIAARWADGSILARLQATTAAEDKRKQ